MICFLGCTPVFSQDLYYGNGQSLKIKESQDIEGSPYYNKEWLVGTVKMKSGKEVTDLPLRFDFFCNDLTYLRNDSVFVVREIGSQDIRLAQFPLLKQVNRTLTQKNYEEMLTDMLVHGYRMAGVFDKRSVLL